MNGTNDLANVDVLNQDLWVYFKLIDTTSNKVPNCGQVHMIFDEFFWNLNSQSSLF